MIREYNENDFNLVNVLGREISNDYILKISPVGVCYVYELEDEIVGFILADVLMIDQRLLMYLLLCYIEIRK